MAIKSPFKSKQKLIDKQILQYCTCTFEANRHSITSRFGALSESGARVQIEIRAERTDTCLQTQMSQRIKSRREETLAGHLR